MCEKVGINNTQETNQMAIQLATFLESQQHIGVESENIMVEAFAQKKKGVMEKVKYICCWNYP